MENHDYNEDLKTMSIYSYKNNKTIPSGWKFIKNYSDNNSGFYADVYKKGNDISIIYRGTDDKQDLINDIEMYTISTPKQINYAKKIFNEIKTNYPEAKIIHSGHSLGGSIAQVMSAVTNCKAVTFNAFGTSKILASMGYNNIDKLNIINYGNPKDFIFGYNVENQPGTTYLTNTSLPANKDYLAHKTIDKKINGVGPHHLENMGKLNNSIRVTPDKNFTNNLTLLKGSVSIDVPYTPEQIGAMSAQEFAEKEKSIMAQLKQGLIKQKKRDYSDYKNPVSLDNRLYTREDIADMSTDEYRKLETEINAQLNTVGIPSKNELTNSNGTVFVKGYTRDDGTKVKSYYRSAPSKN